MTRDSKNGPKPEETDVLLRKELKRRGLSEKEIADTLRKKKRRKPLAFSAVTSRHLVPMNKAAKPPANPSRAPARPRLSDELCTVEFAADRLKVHPKTILRFIRKGRLKATRIGKSYRIQRADLETFAGVPLPASEGASMTSIVDVPGIDDALAKKWSSTIAAALNTRPGTRAPVRADIIYEPERSHMKIVVIGAPGDTLNLLSLIRLWLDQLRA